LGGVGEDWQADATLGDWLLRMLGLNQLNALSVQHCPSLAQIADTSSYLATCGERTGSGEVGFKSVGQFERNRLKIKDLSNAAVMGSSGAFFIAAIFFENRGVVHLEGTLCVQASCVKGVGNESPMKNERINDEL
jgi:hypothetical protein